MERPYHQPVLLEESLEALSPAPGARIVDATVGGGGHAAAILARTGPDGRLIGLDVDDEALRAARERLRSFGARVCLVRASFRELRQVLSDLGIEAVDGVLFDLGVSSAQLESPTRGFRFAEETAEVTPLDMRMDRRLTATAADLLRQASEEEITAWLRELGELREARRLARAIVRARRRAPLRTAADLLRLIEATGVGRGRRHHPATRVFQALRIVVNDELRALERGLEEAVEVLRPGGRVVVLSYHSLEDRIVKRFFRSEARGCVCPPRQPLCTCGRRPRLRILTPRPVRPSREEVERNPRARSARLRAAERLEAA